MGAHRVSFGSEMPRLPSLVQGKEGAASSAGGGTAHGLSPGEKPRRVREACGSLPVAFGYFWPVKSTAPVPARGRTSSALCADLNSGQGPPPAPLARIDQRAKRALRLSAETKAASAAKKKAPLSGRFFQSSPPGLVSGTSGKTGSVEPPSFPPEPVSVPELPVSPVSPVPPEVVPPETGAAWVLRWTTLLNFL